MNERYLKLLIHPDDRTMKDIEDIKSNVKDNLYLKDYLSKNGDAEFTQLIKMAYYEFVPKGELVFEYNSPSLEFFVILSGKISIHYKRKDEDDVVLSHSTVMKDIQTNKKLSKLGLISSPKKIKM